jgi:hypothetical protein
MTKSTGAGGLSKTRLGRVHDVMAGYVEAGDMPGVVTLVSRHGEIHVDVIGKMAFDGAPMQRDTIFRITSMTKPVTAAAAMILVFRSKREFFRHSADPADDGFTAAAARDGRFLDLGLSGHRRLRAAFRPK